MMKKIAISLVCPLIGALLMTSCLGGADDAELSSDVALLSFSIKDLKTKHTITKADGTDSTYTTVMSGSTVNFTIDQALHTVYNSDSIAYRTDVSRVLVSVKSDGGVCYLKPDGEFGSVEDSIDFTQPVVFRVISYDEKFKRDYKVSINVHQVDPKKTAWQKLAGTNLPALDKQKAFVKEDRLYVIGSDADGEYYTASTELVDGASWAVSACSGINGTGLSVLLMGDSVYLSTDAGTYCSEDAVTWTAVSEESEALHLPGEGISHGVAWFSQPLSTNENIVRTIFVATSEAADTCAQVWTKLSTEPEWIEIGTSGNNVFGCPNLENLAVIQYADKMYAFGGKGMGDRKEPLKAFGACYESRDNGVTWKVNEDALSLPKDFEGRNEVFSTATDGEYVWVMWSNGEVWRGRWNGIK